VSVPLPDPDDLRILASAITAGADELVTGDKDTLSVAGQAEIRITDPRVFWSLLRGERAIK
jgi:predicted nucleic acid-binding protein